MAMAKEMPSSEKKLKKKKKAICHENLNLRKKDPQIYIFIYIYINEKKKKRKEALLFWILNTEISDQIKWSKSKMGIMIYNFPHDYITQSQKKKKKKKKRLREDQRSFRCSTVCHRTNSLYCPSFVPLFIRIPHYFYLEKFSLFVKIKTLSIKKN